MAFKAEEVLDKINEAKSYWKNYYEMFRRDFTTVWETDVAKAWGSRYDAARPQFHIQSARKYVRNIVGKARANRPGIKISSLNEIDVSGLADIVRFVESNSEATASYMDAVLHSATCGLGFLKITHDEDAGKVPLKIEAVEDIAGAFLDPDSRKKDGSDAKFCFLERKSKIKNDGEEEKEKSEYQFYEIKDDRKCYWCQIEEEKITDEGEFLCSFLPLIPVYGQVVSIFGERLIFGEARPLKGLQDYMDYLISLNAENAAVALKARIVVDKGSVDLNQVAQTAGDPIQFIERRPFAEDGERQFQMPAVLPVHSNVDSVTAGAALVKGLTSDTTGIYDASLGLSKTDAESGVALENKQAMSDASMSDYMENLCMSIKRVGIILCDVLSAAATSFTALPGMGEDGTIRNVPLMPIDTGNIYVNVRAGKSYDTRKDEFLARLLEVARIFPQQAVNASDIFVRYMDFPGNSEVEQRFFNSLPSNITGSQAVPLAQVQQMEAAMKAELDKRDAEIQRLSLLVQKNTSDTVANATIRANTDLQIEAMKQTGQNERQIKELLAKGEEKIEERAESRRKEIVEFIAKAGGLA